MYIVLMVHSKFREQLLAGFFEKIPYVQTIIIPYNNIAQHTHSHTHLEDLKREILIKNLKPTDIEFVIVESNYGAPGSFGINEATLRQLIEGYKNAQIIAVSSTNESLLKALKYNECVYIVAIGNKDDMFSPQYLNYTKEVMSRIFSISELKILIENASTKQENTLTTSFDKLCALNKSESLDVTKEAEEASEISKAKISGGESPSARNVSSNINSKS